MFAYRVIARLVFPLSVSHSSKLPLVVLQLDIWTAKDVVVLKIARDETWSENIPKLAQFYFDHLFPKVVEGLL